MASCKDCVHYEVCQMHYKQKCELTYETEREVEIAMRKAQKAVDIECDYYKDRARFVELPYKLGDSIYEPKRHQITEYQIARIVFYDFGLRMELRLMKGLLFRAEIKQEDIGKVVFLTREEAERALRSVSK